MDELLALDVVDDPEHALDMVVRRGEDDASHVASPNKVNLVIFKILRHVESIMIFCLCSARRIQNNLGKFLVEEFVVCTL